MPMSQSFRLARRRAPRLKGRQGRQGRRIKTSVQLAAGDAEQMVMSKNDVMNYELTL